MDRMVWSVKTEQAQEMSKNTFFIKGEKSIAFEKTIRADFAIRPEMEKIGNVIKYYLEKPHRLITTLLFPDKDANDTQQRTYRINYSNFVCIMAEMIQKYGLV